MYSLIVPPYSLHSLPSPSLPSLPPLSLPSLPLSPLSLPPLSPLSLPSLPSLPLFPQMTYVSVDRGVFTYTVDVLSVSIGLDYNTMTSMNMTIKTLQGTLIIIIIMKSTKVQTLAPSTTIHCVVCIVSYK